MRHAPLCLLLALAMAARVEASPLPARLAGRSGIVLPGAGEPLALDYDAAGPFANGLAIVGLGPAESRLFGLVDAGGRIRRPIADAELHRPSEGLARFAVDTPAGLRYGYLDPSGAELIPPRFERAGDFSEGLAAAILDGRAGYIGPDGAFRFELDGIPAELGDFNEGLAVLRYSEVDSRVIDAEGGERFATGQRLAPRIAAGRLLVYSASRQRYRFLDREGRPAFDVDYDYARPYGDGRALVKPVGRPLLGYLGEDGLIAIEPRFRQAGSFHEGLAAVLEGARWGYIDARGRTAIAARFLYAGDFEDGWAPVRTTAGPNYVNREGRLAWEPARIPVADRERGYFARLAGLELVELGDGAEALRLRGDSLLAVLPDEDAALAAARRRPGPELLLQGENRHLLFGVAGPPPGRPADGRALLDDYLVSYLEPDPLAEGPAGDPGLARADSAALGALLLARRELPLEQARAVYRALPARLQVLPGLGLTLYPQLLDAGGRLPADELASALAPLPQRGADGLWGFGDLLGNTLLTPAWRWAGEFGEGLAPVSPDSVRIGFVGEDGALRIPARFQGVGRFSEGLCMAIAGDRGGYIDPTGDWVIEPRFVWSGEFREGLAPASLDGRLVGFIDRTGAFVIAPEPQLAGEFGEGLAAVTRAGSVGYVDREGELIIPCRYEAGTVFADGLAAVRVEGRVGYIDHRGEFVITPDREAGTAFALGVAWVVADGRFELIDTRGRVLWAPK